MKMYLLAADPKRLGWEEINAFLLKPHNAQWVAEVQCRKLSLIQEVIFLLSLFQTHMKIKKSGLMPEMSAHLIATVTSQIGAEWSVMYYEFIM